MKLLSFTLIVALFLTYLYNARRVQMSQYKFRDLYLRMQQMLYSR